MDDLFEQMAALVRRNWVSLNASIHALRRDLATLERQHHEWSVDGRLDHETDEFLRKRIAELRGDLIEAQEACDTTFREIDNELR